MIFLISCFLCEFLVPGAKSDDAFVAMAMSETAAIFDRLEAQGIVARGNKQDAVSNAAQTAMNLMNTAEDKATKGEGEILDLLSNPQAGNKGAGDVLGLLENIL